MDLDAFLFGHSAGGAPPPDFAPEATTHKGWDGNARAGVLSKALDLWSIHGPKQEEWDGLNRVIDQVFFVVGREHFSHYAEILNQKNEADSNHRCMMLMQPCGKGRRRARSCRGVVEYLRPNQEAGGKAASLKDTGRMTFVWGAGDVPIIAKREINMVRLEGNCKRKRFNVWVGCKVLDRANTSICNAVYKLEVDAGHLQFWTASPHSFKAGSSLATINAATKDSASDAVRVFAAKLSGTHRVEHVERKQGTIGFKKTGKMKSVIPCIEGINRALSDGSLKVLVQERFVLDEREGACNAVHMVIEDSDNGRDGGGTTGMDASATVNTDWNDASDTAGHWPLPKRSKLSTRVDDRYPAIGLASCMYG